MLPRDIRAQVRRRADYRPPAFLVDTLALEFDLDPTATRVTATLAFRRNPDAPAQDRAAPLALDGEQQGDVTHRSRRRAPAACADRARRERPRGRSTRQTQGR